VVELDLDEVLLGVGEGDSQVTERLLESATGTLNDNVPGLDGDLDPLGDLEQFLRVAVAKCQPRSCIVSNVCVAVRAAANRCICRQTSSSGG
jgi:hypothetical protein